MNSAPKVLFLNHTSTLGGGEIVLYTLVNGLFERGMDVCVGLFAEGDLAEKFSATDIPYEVISLDKTVEEIKKDQIRAGIAGKVAQVGAVFRSIAKVRRFILQSGVDIVYCNSLKSDIIGGIAARLARKKVVWHIHDRISADYLPSIAVKIFGLLMRTIPTHLVAISQSVAETLPVPQSKVSVVHNGIRIDELPKGAKPPFGDESPVFALIGRISPWKGQDVFLDAAKIVHEKYPHVRFQIVGDALFGENEFKSKVLQQCHDLGLDECVSWLGFRSDVPQIMAEVDCVVHASTLGEPFGMVIIEAMWAGRPIIATNGGGVPEIVTNGKDGLLVPMKDSPAMAEAMMAMLESPQMARDLTVKALETVTSRFSIEKTLDGIEAVLKQLKK
jgi:glycosyltransferase involved in cell wall biosynthesis